MKINIVFKSVLDKYKDIEERNRHFDELSDEGKRLEIAWDALQLVLSNKVLPSDGDVYWSFSLMNVKGDSKTLQKAFNTNKIFEKKECRVCERGVIMLSQIRLGNGIDSNDDERYDGSPDNLKGFSFSSMIRMEKEYEYGKYNHPYMNNTKEKMANILCNVLVNGDFNTDDKTDYLTQ